MCAASTLFVLWIRSIFTSALQFTPRPAQAQDGWKPIFVYSGPREIGGAWESVAQCGQDNVIRAMFPKSGYFIDLAANDWRKDSNTYSLETFEAWQGICIEPNEVYWPGLAMRKCVHAAVVVDDKFDQVEFALKGGYGGIIGSGMDNTAAEKDTERKFFSVPITYLFKQFNVPTTIQYMSLDIEGAESRILSIMPFSSHHIQALTVERPKSDALDILKNQGYVEVGILGEFGDTMFINSAVPNFWDLLKTGQKALAKQEGCDAVDLKPKQNHHRGREGSAVGVRCPYWKHNKCGRNLLPWNETIENILKNWE